MVERFGERVERRDNQRNLKIAVEGTNFKKTFGAESNSSRVKAVLCLKFVIFVAILKFL